MPQWQTIRKVCDVIPFCFYNLNLMVHEGSSVSDSCSALTYMGLLLPLLFTWFMKFINDASRILSQYTDAHIK
jgi:hypothetical protein